MTCSDANLNADTDANIKTNANADTDAKTGAEMLILKLMPTLKLMLSNTDVNTDANEPVTVPNCFGLG